MLLEAVISLLLFIPNMILSMIPTIEINLPENIFSGVSGILGTVGYLFPVTALLPIIVVSIALDVARVVVAIIIRIKSFIPTMGA